ncbi:MAG: PilZ domain-containing protein [Selenomonadaceae bacterium]|nr:PilZ domain-containing protein [Selenomonadaceae bacterium]
MHLTQITTGQKANLLLKWQEETLELNTTIVGMTEKGPLIKPYRYRGAIVNFSDLSKSDITMDLFYTDPVTDERLGWTNVALRRVEQDGNICYQVISNPIGSFSRIAERRIDTRIPLNLPGKAIDRATQKLYNITLEDINKGGIAFSIGNDADSSIGTEVDIFFDDSVRDTTYSVKAGCTIVRREATETGTIFGCRIVKPTKSCLLYIYLKHVEYVAGRRYR